jgi:predicted CXXCH cytochrome family protein
MIRALYVTCVLLVALLGGNVTSGYALEIIYPADGTYVIRSNYLIITCGQDPVVEALTIEINGVVSDLIDISSPEYRAVFQDKLIVEPQFDPGSNIIKVDGYAKGQKVSSVEADIYYLDDFSGQAPDHYKQFFMHAPEQEARCVGCHNMNPSEQELYGDSASTNACGTCHQRMLNKKHVHGPAGVFECMACHDAESRPIKYQLLAEEADLCNECHFDKVEQFRESKFIHGPVEAGYCQVCHDSHASDHLAQAITPINELCLACHEGVNLKAHVLRGVGGKSHPLSGRLDPSGKDRMISCASCHDPHGGMSKMYFQRGITNRFVLCQICHAK